MGLDLAQTNESARERCRHCVWVRADGLWSLRGAVVVCSRSCSTVFRRLMGRCLPPPKLGSPRGCLSQPRACVPSVQLAQRTSSQSHTPSQSHTLQQLLQRSTLRDGRVGVGALGKTCAAAGRRGGQAGGLAERGVRRGVLCLLVLRAASTRMVPPTRARRTCAHVAVSRVCGAVVSGGV